jgi:hypothetical protein
MADIKIDELKDRKKVPGFVLDRCVENSYGRDRLEESAFCARGSLSEWYVAVDAAGFQLVRPSNIDVTKELFLTPVGILFEVSG